MPERGAMGQLLSVAVRRATIRWLMCYCERVQAE